MKIVLTTLNAKYIHCSLALRYLRSYVKPMYPQTEICEFTIKDIPSRIVADLYRRQPDVIGFSIYIWNVEETIPVIRMLRQLLPDTRIVLGGPEVSYDTRYWMERIPEVDCIVQGEGEATFLAALEAFEQGATLNQVAGLAYHQDGKVLVNPPRDKIDLSVIPTPYDESEDLTKLQDRVVYYETSRGCPFSCQFCLSSIESGVRYFPVERVKSDILRLMKAGVRTIKFVDRTFNLKRDYAVDLFQFLIEHRSNTVFQFEITGDILHPQTVDFLVKHVPQGLFRFEIGVQSTNDLTNSLVKRRQNFKRLRNNIIAVKDSGNIVQHLDLIAGLPEEDYSSFRTTFDDVFRLQPDELQLGFLKMLRGTGLRLRAREFGYVFMQQAPYEIFSNNVLSYNDVLRIKQVEDVLEKYWNEQRLRTTVQYLTHHVFPSPFDFFQQLGSFWEEQGWDRIGHQLDDLYVRLESFLLSMTDNPFIHQAARSYMIYDFLLQHRIRPHKVWWDRVLYRHDQRMVSSILANPAALGPEFEALDLSAEGLTKHAMIEILPHEIVPLNPSDAPGPHPALLLVYYPPGLPKGARPYTFVGRLDAVTGSARVGVGKK